MRKIINKKSIGVLLVIAIASMSMTVFANPVNTKVFINGEHRATGFIEKGKTYIPLRDVSEALGASVGWENSTKTVTISKSGTIITQRIGQSSATVNGRRVNAGAPALIRNSTTYVPIRFISETFGTNVQWDQATRSVQITDSSLPSKEEQDRAKYEKLIEQASKISHNYLDYQPITQYTTLDKIPYAGGTPLYDTVAFIDNPQLNREIDEHSRTEMILDIKAVPYNGRDVLEITRYVANRDQPMRFAYVSKKQGFLTSRRTYIPGTSNEVLDMGNRTWVITQKYELPFPQEDITRDDVLGIAMNAPTKDNPDGVGKNGHQALVIKLNLKK